MALSLPISLTTVRDFFGSSSNNLTALHKGENNVANPAAFATSNFNEESAASGTNFPVALFDNGGVAPSLASVNSSIGTSERGRCGTNA